MISFLRREFLYNGHLQSLGAAGVFYFCARLLYDANLSILLIISIYLLFEMIFIFDRYYDLDWDAPTNNERAKHLYLYKNKIPYIFLIIFGIYILLFYNLATLPLFGISLIVLILGVLYPIFFKKLTKFIPLFKNIYVSAVYAVLPVFAMIQMGYISPFKVLSVHLPIVIFVESLVAQIILDTKDTSVDKKAHLKTLPALFGNEVSLLAAFVLSLALCIVSVSVSLLTKAPTLFLILTIFAFFADICTLKLVKMKDRRGYLIAAGKFLIWSLAFLIFQMI